MFIDVTDSKRIMYEGTVKRDRIYALTLTSRTHYSDPIDFRRALYDFLRGVEYKSAMFAVMEFHNQIGRDDKVHAHGIVYNGIPPKGNKTNDFHFKLKKVSDLSGWEHYCLKNALDGN